MAVTIEPLLTGTLSCPRSQLEADATDTEITIPVPSWLIRHPKGVMLMDCGMHTDLAAPSDYLDLVSLFFRVGLTSDQLVGERLNAVGVDPADVDIVVLSHLHFDHAGGLSQLPNARVIVQRDEWAAGGDDDIAGANGFVPTDYRLGHDVVTVDGEHDVFGDGLVTCIPTPGHTPGHQSLRVRLADREIVLCGDCAYFEETLNGGALPPGGNNPDLHRASVERLKGLGAAGATLVPGHDPDTFAALGDRLN